MATITEYSVYHRRIPWHPASRRQPLPLGRNVHHDGRNLWYPYQHSAPTLVSVLHARMIPILDQGNVGSCTGNGQVGVMGCDPDFASVPASVTLNEAEALKIYSAAETIDGDGPYPPNDNGSSGPSAAQAAKNFGLISGYTHCLSLADVLDALQTSAVSIGINWYSSFDNPPSSGLLTISPNASIRGGHEPMLRGIDVTAQTVFGDNSWGTSWGVNGSFIMGWATLERLLAEQGDGTVSIPLSQPAPVPVPPVPVPVPVPPVPPAPVPGDPSAKLWADTAKWRGQRHTGSNAAACASVKAWGAAEGFK